MEARHRVVVRKLLAMGAGGAKIIDIGCGRGLTVSQFRRQGFDAWGCEPGDAVPYDRDAAGRLFLKTDFQTLDPDFRSAIEVCTLLDVLEHVDKPRDWIERILESFPSLRYMVLTAPARRELWTNYDEYYGHKTRFTLRSLAELLAPFGFTVREMGYFFHALYLPLWLQARLGLKRRLSNQGDFKLPEAQPALASFFDWEQRLVPGFIPGSSVLAVLEARR